MFVCVCVWLLLLFFAFCLLVCLFASVPLFAFYVALPLKSNIEIPKTRPNTNKHNGSERASDDEKKNDTPHYNERKKRVKPKLQYWLIAPIHRICKCTVDFTWQYTVHRMNSWIKNGSNKNKNDPFFLFVLGKKC